MVKSMPVMVNRLLLHCCCAPCTVMCAQVLRGEGIEPVLYWYNPNIHPYTEYARRRDTLAAHARSGAFELIMRDEYGLRPFLAGLPGDAASVRCAYCYRLRMEETAREAKKRGLGAFSTTLLISPYQDHERLTQTARTAAERYGAPFLYRDFRPYFRAGQAKAREAGYYMQQYCGCVFSEEERYAKTGAAVPPGSRERAAGNAVSGC